MKYIIKGSEPIELTIWKDQTNEDWIPTYDDLRGNVKSAVYEALKKEQGFICCYCERELANNNYHIEHHNPQENEIVDSLEFSNMLCSCQRSLKRGDELHCGNSKGCWFDETKFVSPLNPNCETKFKYTFDGHIEPYDVNDVAAFTTIKKLRLGIDKLNVSRRSAIAPFIDEEISIDDLNDFVRGYLIDKNENGGKYNEFYTTIKYLFEN